MEGHDMDDRPTRDIAKGRVWDTAWQEYVVDAVNDARMPLVRKGHSGVHVFVRREDNSTDVNLQIWVNHKGVRLTTSISVGDNHHDALAQAIKILRFYHDLDN